MPNWTYNSVTISGKMNTINKFKETHFTSEDDSSKKNFDFETIIPMPNSIFRGNMGKQEREIHGANNWYDWSIENWGTKWNACHCEIHETSKPNKKGIVTFQFKFETAWSVPYPIYEKLAKMYKDLTFDIYYEDEGGGFAGEIEIKKGELHETETDPTSGYEYD